MFTEHALENHSKAKVFFTAETIAEQFKLDIIKNEDTEFFEYENYDFEPNYNTTATDFFPSVDVLGVPEEKIKQEQKRSGNCDSGEVIDQIFDQPFLNAIYKTRKVLDTVNCQTVGERQR